MRESYSSGRASPAAAHECEIQPAQFGRIDHRPCEPHFVAMLTPGGLGSLARSMVPTLLIMLAPIPLAAQGELAIDSALTDRVTGTIQATLPSGETFRGSNATVYLWVDSPELHASLDAACTASRANPAAWLAARTELEAPAGMPLDSTAAADLALLQRLASAPHATTRADSIGGFAFIDVPFGKYWVEAEMTRGADIMQWWDGMEVTQGAMTLAKLMHADRTLRLDLGTRYFTRDQFCTASAPRDGIAAFASETRDAGAEQAYEHVDVPAKVTIPGPVPKYPDILLVTATDGQVELEYVVDTTGRVDPRTVRVVRSSNYDIAAAVKESLLQTVFEPARLNGRKVRWITRQSVAFHVVSDQLH